MSTRSPLLPHLIREPESFWSLGYFPGCVSHYPHLSVLLSPGLSTLYCCIPNSSFPTFSSSLCAFPFFHLSSVCLMCKQASTRLCTGLGCSAMSCPICLIRTCSSSIFVALSLHRSCFAYNKFFMPFLYLVSFSTLSCESQLSTVDQGWGKNHLFL